MPHALINGARLWYDVLGAAAGEPILLHHGYTASRVNWMPVAERLAERFRVILMECRGTGASEHTADGYTLEQYAADVLGLVDRLGIDRFTFAGHSMAGGIGFLLGLDHAERLERLVLMAPIAADGSRGDAELRARRRGWRESGDRAAFLAHYRSMYSARHRNGRVVRGASITSCRCRMVTATAASPPSRICAWQIVCRDSTTPRSSLRGGRWSVACEPQRLPALAQRHVARIFARWP
jgi:pimeloyl-ACP methyl ester carboxylesterase